MKWRSAASISIRYGFANPAQQSTGESGDGRSSVAGRPRSQILYPDTSRTRGRSLPVGAILSADCFRYYKSLFPEMVRGFEESASQRGYDTIVVSTNYDPARTAMAVRRMIERQVDGVGIMTSEMDQKLVDEMANRDVPMVFLDVATPGAEDLQSARRLHRRNQPCGAAFAGAGTPANRLPERAIRAEIGAHPARCVSGMPAEFRNH